MKNRRPIARHSHSPSRTVAGDRRRLRFESLEDRRLLAIIVDTLIDENDGVNVGGVSLRDAIADAAPSETINFAAALTAGGPATIYLLHGELAINKSLTINGPGANLLTVDASTSDLNPELDQGDGSRVFNIDDNSFNDIAVAVRGLKLTGGDVNGRGGAISSWESLTLVDAIISGNAARGTLGAGGGIWSRRAGALQIMQSTISGNSAQSNGGGVWARVYDSGQLTITDSTISGNSTSDKGGGLYADALNSGTVTIANSTISGNTASSHGGGVYSRTASGSATAVIQSTLSGNFSDRSGGGIWSYTLGFTTATISHSTITGNTADANSNNPVVETGGGIFAAGSGTLHLNHSLVAANTDTGNHAPDVKNSVAALPASFSLIGDRSGSGFAAAPIGSPDANGNLVGGAANAKIVPQLAPLADNGGPTFTHALLLSSPAINAGNPSAVAGSGGIPNFDQRGAPFQRVFSGAGQSFTRIDIGAYELNDLGSAETLVVDSPLDGDDGNFTAGQFSLREAIRIANGLAIFEPTITFAASLSGQTIPLTGELVIAQEMTIDAGALLGGVTITAGPSSRVLRIDDNLPANVLNVTLRGLSIAGGSIQGDGGGILSRENLVLNNCTVTGNEATGAGGGIHATLGASLSIMDSAITSNEAGSRGGGIFAPSAVVTLTNTAVSENTSLDQGGGVYMETFGAVTGGVFSNNTSQSTGGGIAVGYAGGPGGRGVVVSDSLITGNTGGGIWGRYANISVSGSTISNNSTSGSGAGIYVISGGSIAVTNSTVSNNHAVGSGGGLAMHPFSGTIDICNSTITGNSADDNGGGVYGNNRTKVVLTNSTVSGNLAKGSGGGIWAVPQFNHLRPQIRHATITNNVADSDNNGVGGGGGLRLTMGADVENSIISGNTASAGSEPDVHTAFGGGRLIYSLIGQDHGTPFSNPDYAFSIKVGSIIGTAAAPANPGLGPLDDNGGPNKTHALLPGSVAIDGGDPAAVAGVGTVPRYDGRGTTYDRIVNSRVDMGAFEFAAVTADFDEDGDADGSDFLVWQRNLGTVPPNGLHENGDADLDGEIDGSDLAVLARQFGAPTCINVAMAADTAHGSVTVSSADEGKTSEIGRDAALDAIYAAGDFSGLFTPLQESGPFWPGRRRRLR
jgi:hypothetical protein